MIQRKDQEQNNIIDWKVYHKLKSLIETVAYI